MHRQLQVMQLYNLVRTRISCAVLVSAVGTIMLLAPVNCHGEPAKDTATLAEIEQRLKTNPNDAAAHSALGQYYEKSGMEDFAREQFALAFKLDPSRDEQAFENFEREFHSSRPSNAFPDWIQIRLSHPGSTDVRIMDEMVTHLYGSPLHAESVFLHDLSRPDALHEINIEMSMLESAGHNYQRALELASEDLAVHPSDAGWLARAMALNGMHQPEQAIKPALVLYNANPFIAGAGREVARAYQMMGRPESAVTPAVINVFLWQAPDDIESARKLCTSIIRETSPAKLDAEISKAEAIIARRGLQSQFYSEMALIFSRCGMKDRTVSLLEHAIAAGSNDPDVYCRYANLIATTPSGCQKAIAALQQSSRLDPMNPNYQCREDQLQQRIANQRNDIAWRLKLVLRGLSAKTG